MKVWIFVDRNVFLSNFRRARKINGGSEAVKTDLNVKMRVI